MYNNNKTNEEDGIIIPSQLFEIQKNILFYKYHSVKRMKIIKNLLNKFYNLTNENLD